MGKVNASVSAKLLSVAPEILVNVTNVFYVFILKSTISRQKFPDNSSQMTMAGAVYRTLKVKDSGPDKC